MMIFACTFFTAMHLTSPPVLLSLLLRSLFFVLGAAVLLQRVDGALSDHRLPPELTVVNDFDDDWRHVELLAGKSLWRGGEREKQRLLCIGPLDS